MCGLDSVMARRWINSKLVSSHERNRVLTHLTFSLQCDLLQYDDDGNLNIGTVIPMIDGGTEGFSGNARVILPGLTACVECTLSLYPPQVLTNYRCSYQVYNVNLFRLIFLCVPLPTPLGYLSIA